MNSSSGVSPSLSSSSSSELVSHSLFSSFVRNKNALMRMHDSLIDKIITMREQGLFSDDLEIDNLIKQIQVFRLSIEKVLFNERNMLTNYSLFLKKAKLTIYKSLSVEGFFSYSQELNNKCQLLYGKMIHLKNFQNNHLTKDVKDSLDESLDELEEAFKQLTAIDYDSRKDLLVFEANYELLVKNYQRREKNLSNQFTDCKQALLRELDNHYKRIVSVRDKKLSDSEEHQLLKKSFNQILDNLSVLRMEIANIVYQDQCWDELSQIHVLYDSVMSVCRQLEFKMTHMNFLKDLTIIYKNFYALLHKPEFHFPSHFVVQDNFIPLMIDPIFVENDTKRNLQRYRLAKVMATARFYILTQIEETAKKLKKLIDGVDSNRFSQKDIDKRSKKIQDAIAYFDNVFKHYQLLFDYLCLYQRFLDLKKNHPGIVFIQYDDTIKKIETIINELKFDITFNFSLPAARGMAFDQKKKQYQQFEYKSLEYFGHLYERRKNEIRNNEIDFFNSLPQSEDSTEKSIEVPFSTQVDMKAQVTEKKLNNEKKSNKFFHFPFHFHSKRKDEHSSSSEQLAPSKAMQNERAKHHEVNTNKGKQKDKRKDKPKNQRENYRIGLYDSTETDRSKGKAKMKDNDSKGKGKMKDNDSKGKGKMKDNDTSSSSLSRRGR